MDIQQEIQHKIQEIKRIKLASAQLQKVKDHLRHAAQREVSIAKSVDKEQQDVLDLEKQSIGALLLFFRNDRKEKLEKEREEYLQALFEYKENKKLIQLLEFEKEVLEKKILKYRLLKNELSDLLAQREKTLVFKDKAMQQLMASLNEQIDRNIILECEIDEAIYAGDTLAEIIKEVIYNLRQINGWKSYQLNQPDQDIYRKKYLDKTHTNIVTAKNKIQRFQDELTDIQLANLLSEIIHLFAKFQETYFGDVVNDWHMLHDFKGAQPLAENIRYKLDRILSKLRRKKNKIKETLDRLNSKKEKLILDLN